MSSLEQSIARSVGPGLAALALSLCVAAANAVPKPVPLHVFRGVHHGGVFPAGALLSASDSALYGATSQGGPYDGGTIFRIDRDDTFTTLANFAPIDGANPVGGLVEDADGLLYGVTNSGGEHDEGTIFVLDKDGDKAVLHSFDDDGWGGGPTTGLLRAADGSLYGLLPSGTLYQITPSGQWTPVAYVPPGVQGGFAGAPVQGADGALYVLQQGVRAALVRVANHGRTSTVYDFPYPEYAVAVTVGADGDFYTLSSGNDQKTCLLFSRIDRKGQRETLKSLHCDPAIFPLPGLVEGSDGRFHGAMTIRGSDDKVHYALFDVGTDGSTVFEPMSERVGIDPGPLVEGPDHAFYGTAATGARYGDGSVFRVVP